MVDYERANKHLVQRLRQARRLLEWWEETNHPDDEDSGLASDTRHWLAYMEVDVPPLLTDSDRLYANVVDDEPSQPPPEPGRSDTTALSLAHELHHAQLRRIDGDALPDDHHRSSDSNPRIDGDILSRHD
jgi:hypothetical protein